MQYHVTDELTFLALHVISFLIQPLSASLIPTSYVTGSGGTCYRVNYYAKIK